jgi:mRNA-degrading endonuclease RelE of RelBE toxin-antitoxin system
VQKGRILAVDTRRGERIDFDRARTLQQWPSVSGAKPLRGELAGRYRLRTGDYRIQFRVAGDRVTVEKIGHRDGFYGE